MSRRIPGSLGHRQAKANSVELERRTVAIRQNAWHEATSELEATYSEVVIEDLDITAMKRSMESRPFCRSALVRSTWVPSPRWSATGPKYPEGTCPEQIDGSLIQPRPSQMWLSPDGAPHNGQAVSIWADRRRGRPRP